MIQKWRRLITHIHTHTSQSPCAHTWPGAHDMGNDERYPMAEKPSESHWYPSGWRTWKLKEKRKEKTIREKINQLRTGKYWSEVNERRRGSEPGRETEEVKRGHGFFLLLLFFQFAAKGKLNGGLHLLEYKHSSDEVGPLQYFYMIKHPRSM